MNDDSSKYRVFDELQSVKAKYRELAKAAIAYDLAIQSAAGDPDKMSSFCTAQGDTLDSLYVRWLGLAMKAAGEPVAQVAFHPTSKEDLQVAEEPKDWQKACPDYPNCPNLSCPCEPRSEQAMGDGVTDEQVDRAAKKHMEVRGLGMLAPWESCTEETRASYRIAMRRALEDFAALASRPVEAVATPAEVTEESALTEWVEAGGRHHGPIIETVTMPLAIYVRFRAALAQPRPMGGVPDETDAVIDAMCKIVARNCGEAFERLDDFTKQSLRDTQRQALRAARDIAAAPEVDRG